MKREADAEPAIKRETGTETKKKAHVGEPCADGATAALAKMIIDIGIAGLPSYSEICEKMGVGSVVIWPSLLSL